MGVEDVPSGRMEPVGLPELRYASSPQVFPASSGELGRVSLSLSTTVTSWRSRMSMIAGEGQPKRAGEKAPSGWGGRGGIEARPVGVYVIREGDVH